MWGSGLLFYQDGCLRPTFLGEGGLPSSASGFKCEAHPETRLHTPRVKCDQVSGHSVAQSS